jgi:hypothetical protein
MKRRPKMKVFYEGGQFFQNEFSNYAQLCQIGENKFMLISEDGNRYYDTVLQGKDMRWTHISAKAFHNAFGSDWKPVA